MGLKKGQSNNLNGRPKGVRNKVHSGNKQFWERILKSQRKKIRTELDTLHGRDYMTAVLAANAFVMPKMSSADMAMSVDGLTAEQTQELLNKIIQHGAKG